MMEGWFFFKIISTERGEKSAIIHLPVKLAVLAQFGLKVLVQNRQEMDDASGK